MTEQLKQHWNGIKLGAGWLACSLAYSPRSHALYCTPMSLQKLFNEGQQHSCLHKLFLWLSSKHCPNMLSFHLLLELWGPEVICLLDTKRKGSHRIHTALVTRDKQTQDYYAWWCRLASWSCPGSFSNLCEWSVNLLVLSRSSCLLLTSLLLCLPLYIVPPPPHCVLAKCPVVWQ